MIKYLKPLNNTIEHAQLASPLFLHIDHQAPITICQFLRLSTVRVSYIVAAQEKKKERICLRYLSVRMYALKSYYIDAMYDIMYDLML